MCLPCPAACVLNGFRRCGTAGQCETILNALTNERAKGQKERWRKFWKSTGAGDVVWAMDDGQRVGRLMKVTSAGTTIIIDRGRQISYRDSGATSYETLRAAIARLL